MIRSMICAAFAVNLLAGTAVAASFAETFPQIKDLKPGPERTLLESLDYKTGRVDLPGGFAAVTIPDNYYYLNPADAKKVLVDAWGNPPEGVNTLGMIFPKEYTPFHQENWAVEISWDPIGYVEDKDAGEIDYDELLESMREDAAEANEWRQKNGYPLVTLVGWASPPFYDAQARKLHWAKELAFAGDHINTLNYNMRILGRKGVLVMNFIAAMPQLPQIEEAIPQVLTMAEFNDGSRYADFNPDIDTVAAVGIGGLIAGKVLAKAGMLAVALAFLKKGWILVVLLLGGLWKMLTGRSRQT